MIDAATRFTEAVHHRSKLISGNATMTDPITVTGIASIAASRPYECSRASHVQHPSEHITRK